MPHRNQQALEITMSKDYKIGIVVGSIILIAGVVYYIVNYHQEQPIEPAVTLKETDNQPVLDTTDLSLETPTVPVEISMPGETPSAGGEKNGLKERVKSWEDKWGMSSTDETATPKTADENTVTVKLAEIDAGQTGYASSDEGSGDTDGEYFKLDNGASVTINEKDPGIIRAPYQPAPVAYRGKDTYTIKSNDSLWLIAERVYGPGKGIHYKLIANANPGINPGALPVGKKLRIPPLPKTLAGRPGAVVTPGPKPNKKGLVTNAAGQQIYTVSSSDSAGYWGIAKKVYGPGNASKYTLIQKANRDKKADKLRAGMKLIIPPLPKKTPSTIRSSRSIYRSITSSGRTYTVKKNDTLSKIAERTYGSSKYYNIIIKANQGIDAKNLKIGQKLILPPKPKTTRSPSRRTSAPARSSVRPGEPDFGP